ncbi:hypothetical protein R1flu_013054 [Riccia fluitans]|uniref:ATP synthase F0 subunit 8 n=1 Tax=Riccia fluitans TaxID=41844 RepID=A0ABD1ZGE2_9MARC
MDLNARAENLTDHLMLRITMGSIFVACLVVIWWASRWMTKVLNAYLCDHDQHNRNVRVNLRPFAGRQVRMRRVLRIQEDGNQDGFTDVDLETGSSLSY